MEDKLEVLPNEHYLKVNLIANTVWEEFRFNPYFGVHDFGRSTLEDQLNEINNVEIRDCKLVTYKFVEELEKLGYEWKILINGKYGYHPYVIVHLKDYQNLTLRVSFHPENYICEWFVRGLAHESIRWGEDLVEYAINQNLFILNNNDAWEVLNENYRLAQGAWNLRNETKFN